MIIRDNWIQQILKNFVRTRNFSAGNHFFDPKRGISKGISAKIMIFKEFAFFENKVLPNLKIYLSDRSEFLEMKTYGTLP